MVLEVNGWKLLYHPVFGDRYAQLRARARELKASLPPREFTKHPDVKLVAAVRRAILEIIPEDPNRPDFWLGADLAAFRRVKGYGLPDRYRLYYVFSLRASRERPPALRARPRRAGHGPSSRRRAVPR